MSLPSSFCWTRFGTEAGQPVDSIFTRKELERSANNGLFLWGIGNAVGPSILELIRRNDSPEVIFSPVRSAPKPKDVSPTAVAAWTMGEGLDGTSYALPAGSIVTSRYDPIDPRSYHYALVCYTSRRLLNAESEDRIALGALSNLLTGKRIGASQVTAVVSHAPVQEDRSACYEVTVRAQLAFPYLVRLRNPVILNAAARVAGLDWMPEAFRLIRERQAAEAGGQFALQWPQNRREGPTAWTPASFNKSSAVSTVCSASNRVVSRTKQRRPHAIA